MSVPGILIVQLVVSIVLAIEAQSAWSMHIAIIGALISFGFCIYHLARFISEEDKKTARANLLKEYGTTQVYRIHHPSTVAFLKLECANLPSQADFDRMKLLYSLHRGWKIETITASTIQITSGAEKWTEEGVKTTIAATSDKKIKIVLRDAGDKVIAVVEMYHDTFEAACWRYYQTMGITVGDANVIAYPAIQIGPTGQGLEVTMKLSEAEKDIKFNLPREIKSLSCEKESIRYITKEGKMGVLGVDIRSTAFALHLCTEINKFLIEQLRSFTTMVELSMKPPVPSEKPTQNTIPL